jgi:PBP1b-binding outer membrane lipoprotein LpoB
MQPFNKIVRAGAIALAAVCISGCSEYLDRRDALSVQSGNAVQADKVSQMVDPWPRVSADRNIAFNGSVMESAVERYRTGRVIQPVGNGTSGAYQGGQNNSGAAAGIGQPTAPPPSK